MNQKDLMKQLQKKNIHASIGDLRECLSMENFKKEPIRYLYDHVTEQLQNIENLVKSYDGDFEKHHLLSRIEYAKDTVHYGSPTTKNQAMIILMVLDEIESIINNDNSSPKD